MQTKLFRRVGPLLAGAALVGGLLLAGCATTSPAPAPADEPQAQSGSQNADTPAPEPAPRAEAPTQETQSEKPAPTQAARPAKADKPAPAPVAAKPTSHAPEKPTQKAPAEEPTAEQQAMLELLKQLAAHDGDLSANDREQLSEAIKSAAGEQEESPSPSLRTPGERPQQIGTPTRGAQRYETGATRSSAAQSGETEKPQRAAAARSAAAARQRAAQQRVSAANRQNRPQQQPAQASGGKGCGPSGEQVDLTPPPPDAPQPKFVCLTPQVTQDDVWKGDRPTFEFKFRNDGEGPLAIRLRGG